MKKVLLIIFLLSIGDLIWAQTVNKWGIYVDPKHSSIDKTNTYYLVESLEQKSNNAFKVVRRLDANHMIVRTDESMLKNTNYWRVNDEWKIDINPNLSHDLLMVVGSSELRIEEWDVIGRYENIYLIESESNTIELLKANPEVWNISNDIAIPSVEARVIDLNLNPNRVNKLHREFPQLNGSSELVSIQEDRFRNDDIDLLGKAVFTGLESDQFDNHADEMATIIAGRGNSFVTGKGVAMEARITSSAFFPVLPDDDSHYLNNGILTQNHSYGIPQDTSYQAEAVAFDLSAYNNPNLLHVFSSGNEGLLTSPGGEYKGIEGYANLTGDIKMTKNSLVVGSVDTVGNAISFASRGPTYDGRVKPEVVAYSVVGSSNSAALVSGISTLLQQQYRINQSEDMPSALLKSILINSAMDVGEDGPDFVTGYGSVNAERSLQTLMNSQYMHGEVAEGEVATYELNLPTGAVNLKVTLVWLDPPANAGDSKALVNDLDFRLIDGAGVTLPWVLDASPNIASLTAPATRGIDRLNNVEQITIEEPLSSTTIEVQGFDVSGEQAFYIAYQYDLENAFTWDFPTGSDNMPYDGETGSYFRWTTTRTGSGLLEFSVDNGASWVMLDNSVPLASGYWRWNNPPVNGDSAIARMTIDMDQYETDVFTLSVPVEASVGFNCGDSLMLRWNKIEKAVSYRVYSLGETILEEVANTMDTFLVIRNKSALIDERFTIQPILEGNKSLLQAPTFDYTLQGIGCYVFSFFQTVALDTGIYLNLQLGTTYGVDEIVFKRNIIADEEDIHVIENPSSDSYVFLDENPAQGYNEHIVVITFQNGEQLTLTAGSSYYLTEVPVRVFPNPAVSGGFIDIITRQFEDTTPLFELLDTNGAVILTFQIEGAQDYIELPFLEPGVYFYRLSADGDSYTGRVIIR